jgi:hypothetical protein
MGFLKRLFSIGSKRKKNKRLDPNTNGNDEGLRRIQEDEREAAVGRLLRSSSARFAVISEADYTVPPMRACS